MPAKPACGGVAEIELVDGEHKIFISATVLIYFLIIK
jgi:hypothetical protein